MRSPSSFGLTFRSQSVVFVFRTLLAEVLYTQTDIWLDVSLWFWFMAVNNVSLTRLTIQVEVVVIFHEVGAVQYRYSILIQAVLLRITLTCKQHVTYLFYDNFICKNILYYE